MNRITPIELLDKYFERVFDTDEPLEDAGLERQWLRRYGYTEEEFAQIMKEYSIKDLDII